MITRTAQDTASEVTALFAGQAQSFKLPEGATLADLCELLADVGADRDLQYVRVLCSPKQAAPRRRLAA